VPSDKPVMMNSPIDLGKKVPDLPKGASVDPIAAAEKALESMTEDFSAWMDEEARRLTEAWQRVSKEGMTANGREALYSPAHDIKGEAATFGYPLAGEIAGGLCLLLDADVAPDKLPLKLVGAHVNAIMAIVKEEAKDAEHRVGRTLERELATLVDDFLAGNG